MRGLDVGDRRILFVGGKGGVGKTTTASTLALLAAEQGRRVLLVSTDPAHSLGDLFDARIGDRAREVLPRLHALEIDPDREVDQYLEGVERTMRGFVHPDMHREIERQMSLTRQSPGATEAALMERMARIMGGAEGEHDQIIFDTAPTGHTLRLLALPEIMTAWMDGLLRGRERSDTFGRALRRLGAAPPPGPELDQGVAVEREDHAHDAGEREPEERREDPAASDRAGAPAGDDLSWFQQTEDEPADPRGRRIRELLMDRRRRFSAARRLLLEPETTAFVMVLVPEKLPVLETEKAVAVLQEHRVPVAGLVVNRVLPAEPLGDFLESRRGQEAEYLDRIDRSFARYVRVRVPLLRRDVQGVESLREIARHLPVAP